MSSQEEQQTKPRKRDIFLKPFRRSKSSRTPSPSLPISQSGAPPEHGLGSTSTGNPQPGRSDRPIPENECPPLPAIHLVLPSEAEAALVINTSQVGLANTTEALGDSWEATQEGGRQASASPRLGRTIYEGVKTTLQKVVEVSDVFPPLKSTAAGLLAICNAIDAYDDNKDEFEKLLKRVEALSRIMESCPEDVDEISSEVKDRISGLARTIEEHTQILGAKLNPARSTAERVFLHPQDRQTIAKITQEIRFAVEIAMFEVTMENGVRMLQAVKKVDWLKEDFKVFVGANKRIMGNIEETVNKLRRSDLLKKLGEVNGAEFGNSKRGPGCIPGTRISLLAKLLSWAEDLSSPNLCWLSGPAGTGKTAVSKTLCAQLNERNVLGASFFCSLKEKDQRDVYLIIPTLARILADLRPEFGDALERVLESDKACRNPTEMTPHDQYSKLMVQPAKEVFEANGEVLVLCVDALDECEDKDATRLFLDAVLRQEPHIPLKVFLTSRPEGHLREAFQFSSHHQHFRLHDIEWHIVQADITLFLATRLKGINAIYDHYRTSWPPPEIGIIAEFCGPLFIVAFTAYKYIHTSTGNCLKRFQEFAQRSSDLKLQGIDLLYDHILSQAYDDLDEDEAVLVHSCLSLLVSAAFPLSVYDYAQLIGTDTGAIREAFKSLHSVVQAPNGNDDQAIISIYHASFVDHLTSKKRLGERWSIEIHIAHSEIASACLALMESMLCFGISGAQTSYRSNYDQPEPLRLASELDYACGTWLWHVSMTQVLGPLQRKLSDFLKGENLLYWLEGLSVVRRVADVIGLTLALLQKISQTAIPKDLQQLMDDVGNFLRNFWTPISHSVPHLYLSALPFFAATGVSSSISFQKFPSVPTVHRRPRKGGEIVTFHCGDSDLLHFSFTDGGKYIRSVLVDGTILVSNAQTGDRLSSRIVTGILGPGRLCRAEFSPDFKVVAIGVWDDYPIFMLDVQTGELVTKPLVHTDFIRALAFSPTGGYLVSGSDDNIVRVWDCRTGDLVLNPMEGHTEGVSSVAFSPDSRLIASGSFDGTARVWNAQTGLLALEPLTGHSGYVWRVIFSPDGKRLASCSADQTIRMWDVETGDLVFQPMEGHHDIVRSIAFSPNGQYIASGSDDLTIRIWDAETGLQVAEPIRGCRLTIVHLVYSPDGRHIVSGHSQFFSFQMWEVHIPRRAAEASCSHTSSVNSVLFSPDGRTIASSSRDGTIRFWDTHTGSPIANPIDVESNVRSLAFTSDGLLLSASDDLLVRLWDLKGAPSLIQKFSGHTDTIWSVASSPDCRYVASSSEDGMVHIWDAQTADQVNEPICYEERVPSLSFSADGRSIACSAPSGNAIALWNISNREEFQQRFVGHREQINSIAFSPCGKLIVSGANDKSIRLWDAQTGAPVLPPMEGHTDRVTFVAFSPDGEIIVSGSWDKTVGLWSSRSGASICFLKGHVDFVTSVAFAPDGEHIVSGACDNSIRLWKTSPLLSAHHLVPGAELDPKKYSFLDDYPTGALTLDDDGWIRNRTGDLLLWVPSNFRDGLFFHPALVHMITNISTTKVELLDAVYHGEEWRECRNVAPEGDGRPWPIYPMPAPFYHDSDSPLAGFFEMAEERYSSESALMAEDC